MDFSVRFTEEGKRKLHELHIENQRDIKKALKQLSKNINLGEPLTGRLKGYYSLHIGNYRAIYLIEGEVIFVQYVGHRRSVYSNFKS